MLDENIKAIMEIGQKIITKAQQENQEAAIIIYANKMGYSQAHSSPAMIGRVVSSVIQAMAQDKGVDPEKLKQIFLNEFHGTRTIEVGQDGIASPYQVKKTRPLVEDLQEIIKEAEAGLYDKNNTAKYQAPQEALLNALETIKSRAQNKWYE